MVSLPEREFPAPSQVSAAAIFQVRDGELQVLLWQRGTPPHEGRWSLPEGYLAPGESLEQSILRHLAAKVDVREVAHLEQLGTWSAPDRYPDGWEVTTAYMGVVASNLDPSLPDDTQWHPVDGHPEMAFDHEDIVLTARERLRAKLSYTNMGFALSPPTFTMSELRDIYRAALGHPVSATNLQRVLVRRGELEPTGKRRAPGAGGGRPAAEFHFRSQRLEVTDPFAVLRPPRMEAAERHRSVSDEIEKG